MRIRQLIAPAAIAIVLAIVSAPALDAQRYSNIDFDSIQQRITDGASPYYYPALLKRYLANDATLRRDDFVHLYYGYVFHDKYDPVNGGQLRREKQMMGYYKAGNYRKALALAKPLAAADPFNLDYLYWAGICSERLRDTLAALAYRGRWRSIAQAIRASGDGRSPATAYVVIRVPDEYQLLQALRLRSNEHIFRGNKTQDRYYDIFPLQPNAQGLDTLYFNTNWSYQRLNATVEQLQPGQP